MAETFAGFKQAARSHQARFRESVLRVEHGPHPHVLKEEDARKGLIFFEPFRKAIMEELEGKGASGNRRMLANLLRSEHIPYNVFFPMREDLLGTARLFNEILGRDEIARINGIRIEFAPKPARRYLDDRTAFDAYIPYTDRNGRPCGIGIEVKYTEKGYPLKAGSRESRRVVLAGESGTGLADTNGAYRQATDRCGYYGSCPPYHALAGNDLRQMWRNHMLGASMVQRGDIFKFTGILLYPASNCHFSDKAIPRYQALLTKKGADSFVPLTYEALFPLIRKLVSVNRVEEWVDYLSERYLT